MSAPLDDTLTADEARLLAPFVTNLEHPIFGLRNLPEVVKGALFSRYSRSDKSLRRLLLDEFLRAPELGLERTVEFVESEMMETQTATRQAEAFYDRVLIGYGDDSVAELGGAHIACENISNIVAKAIEDSRIGLSPLEKSTRYVAFDRKVSGQYRYYIEPTIAASPYAESYRAALNNLFDTYSALIEPLASWIRARTPKDEATSSRAYNSATKAKALDLLRGLLPMATLTNVGLFGNGRAFEYMLTKLAASPHFEARETASSIQRELDILIPAFVKRAKTDRGLAFVQYLADVRTRTEAILRSIGDGPAAESGPRVQLIEYDPQGEQKLVAAILYPHADMSLEQLRYRIQQLSSEELTRVIDAAIGDRRTRFHRPGRAFEEVYYTFDILADIGAYRDLQRHRILTQDRQRFTVRHGYITPREIEEAGMADRFKAALDFAGEVAYRVSASFPDAAQYIVPLAYLVRWRIKLNLREAYHLIELRSSRQGHPSYRRIAQEMFRQIRAVHPSLAAGMQFVDLSSYELERLVSEQRIDTKRAEQADF